MNLPPYLLQAAPGQESNACTAFSFMNLLWRKTGWLISPKDLANISDLEEPSDENCANILNKVETVGVTSYSNCPLPVPLSFKAFYSGQTNVSRHKLSIQLVAPDLKVSDLWTWLQWGSDLEQPTNHIVVVIDDKGNFIDSEPGGQIKNINDPSIYGQGPAKVMWQKSIIINNPLMQIFTVVKQDGKTFGVAILTPNGLQVIFATTPEQWVSWSSPTSYAVNTANPDGTPNWQAQYTLPF